MFVPPQNVGTNRSLGPAVISAFGDFSLALGSNLLLYLPSILETLEQASQAEVNLVGDAFTLFSATTSMLPRSLVTDSDQ